MLPVHCPNNHGICFHSLGPSYREQHPPALDGLTTSRQYSWYLNVMPMLQALSRTSLEQRRSDTRATMMYQIHYNLIDLPSVVYLQPNIRDTLGPHLKYHRPASIVLAHRHSFFPETVRICNALPSHVVLAPSLETFRTSLVSSRS